FRMDMFSDFALLARGRLLFQEIVDLVLEPRDRVFAEIDVLRKFSSRLEPANMHTTPRNAARFQVGERQQPAAGTLTGDFWTCCHGNPRTLMLCEDLLHRAPLGVPDNS